MNAFVQDRPGIAAGMLAFMVHVLFFVLLVFGVSWQIHNPSPVMVDLWSSLPSEPLPPPKPLPVEPPPAPKPAPLPQPVAPPPPPKPVEQPKTKAPDIALEKIKKAKAEARAKAEAEAKAKAAEKAKAEAEKLRKEQELAEQKEEMRQAELEAMREQARIELDQKKQEAALQAAQLKREEAEMQKRMLAEAMAEDTSQLKALQSQAAQQRASEISRIVADYRDRIRIKIRGNTRIPDNMKGNPLAWFQIGVLPTGDIVKVKLVKSSGSLPYDQAVERAIYKSSPLPMPTDQDAMAQFRKIDLKFQPNEN
jgi:colicin import membrane protein